MDDPYDTPSADARHRLVELFDESIGDVHGYLARRCGSASTAEELTAETFLAAADTITRRPDSEPNVAWLIGIARHKLVDHWRRLEREQRTLAAVGIDADPADDRWEARLDVLVARETLAALGPHHRSALTLRYVDGLPVREVADALGRTEKATEVLLVRARAAFRAHYESRQEES